MNNYFTPPQIEWIKCFIGVLSITWAIILVISAIIIALSLAHITIALICIAILLLAGLLLSIGITFGAKGVFD